MKNYSPKTMGQSAQRKFARLRALGQALKNAIVRPSPTPDQSLAPKRVEALRQPVIDTARRNTVVAKPVARIVFGNGAKQYISVGHEYKKPFILPEERQK